MMQSRINKWLTVRPNITNSSEPFRMLDVAFGDGKVIEFFSKSEVIDIHGIHPSRRVQYGCDINPFMAKGGADRLSQDGISVQLSLCDGQNLPYADRVFDMVTHVGSINSWPSMKSGIDEFWRVTKPGGLLMFVDEDVSNASPFWRNYLKTTYTLSSGPDYTQRWTAPVEFVPNEALDFVNEQVILDKGGFEDSLGTNRTLGTTPL